ncbi:MAG: glycosyltransferase [Bifidobacterium sp.]|jgi:glycosyltransferase involved in cell wall biosynthesis
MLTLINNRTYEVVIESMETLAAGPHGGKNIIRGWAVDKFRCRALPLSVKGGGEAVLKRSCRKDIRLVFGLHDDAASGFDIVLPDGMTAFDLIIETPGKSLSRHMTISRIRDLLRRDHVQKRMRQMLYYVFHAWTPAGMRALLAAVKRRFTKKQGFYEDWIKHHETMTRHDCEELIRGFHTLPLISVVVPVYNVEETWLRRCVESMQNQWYPNWQLCLADDCSSSPSVKPVMRDLAEHDSRIKVVFREQNGRISAATNSAIELATGEYVGFMDNDDELAPQALFEVVKAINENPETDFIYTDEDKITEDGVRFDPFFKPDFSPNLLLGHNYITHFVVVSTQLLGRTGLLRSQYDGSQDYDFVLRATEQARSIRHIPQQLYHWRTLASSVAGDPHSKMYAYEAGRRAIEAALERRGVRSSVSMLDNLGTYKIDYEAGSPSVAVLVSSYTPRQLEAVKKLTDYTSVRFIPLDGRDVNDIARECDEPLLVLLDGLKPTNSAWLREMVNYSRISGIGAVGGKVFDDRQRVLNVGVTLNALRSGQPFEMRGEWDEGIGYYFRDLLPRDMFAVTEDCMLVSRKNFCDLNGLDKRLSPGLRGIDYCVRLAKQTGLTTLWQPYSTFTDAKKSHLDIPKDGIVRYLNTHHALDDRFTAAYFPPQPHRQEGIEHSIDYVDMGKNGETVTITGWVADLHAGEVVDIALAQSPWLNVRKIERLVRLDVNTSLAVPANAVLGFKVELGVTGGRMHLAQEKPVLVFTTSTDREEVPVPVSSSATLSAVISFGRKVALLGHPRRTTKRLIEKYWAPHWQRRAYAKLIKRTEQYDMSEVQRALNGFAYKPLISLLVPVYNVDRKWLEKCVESIKGQYYPHWQLCLADDCSTQSQVRPLLSRFADEDSRIKIVFREKNGHISRATNSALELADGEFVGLLDNDDELAPQALFEVVAKLNERPETDMVYSDEDKEDEEGNRFDPHFKPDYSPDLLLSTNYISHFGVYRKSIVEDIGGFRPGYEGSQDYDLVLRFTERTTPSRIQHVAKVLYHWRTLATSTASSSGAKNYASDAGLRALRSAMERRDISADVRSGVANGIYDVHYAIADNALVSVIIPTKDGYDNIERCVESIIAKTDYPNYEIIVADNGSTNPHMWDLYHHYEKCLGDRFTVEKIDIPFNFSRINNIASRCAQGKYLLFLNDDTEVIHESWMTRMVSFAQHERIGVVGAKLYYPTETIQHAGIVLGLGGAAGHIQVGYPRNYLGYFGRLIENVNYYAVTAACCMVAADDFWAVNGFDEKLAVAYNDVDLCIRIHDQLRRDIVWAHEVELYHYESVTRGYDVANKSKKERLNSEARIFKAKYPQIVDNDPYYNPNLSRTSGNFWVRES